MSINMEGSGVEYADHEVQVISAQVFADGTGNTDLAVNLDPVSDRGLDSDELAELVYMRRTATVFNDQTEQDLSPANTIAECDLGINLDPSEFPSAVTNVGNEVPPGSAIQGGTNPETDGTLTVANYDEPGILDTFSFQTLPSFDDDTGGGGAGGFNGITEREVNLPDQFGSGPYVDATDDITLHLETGVSSTEGNATFEVKYFLYWNVEEMPEGRASFARP